MGMESGKGQSIAKLNKALKDDGVWLNAYRLKVAELNQFDKEFGQDAGILLRLMIMGWLNKAADWAVDTVSAWDEFANLLAKLDKGREHGGYYRFS